MRLSTVQLTWVVAFVGLALAHPATAQTTRLDPTFQPPHILSGAGSGTVNEVVQQADGKYVIGGSFNTINGVKARNLARLNADGTLDAAFTANCAANRPVQSLAVQPDGRILVGGSFDSLAAGRRYSVGRLLPSGALDAAFDAGLASGSTVSQVAALPGGDALLLIPTGPGNGVAPSGLLRLNGQTGRADADFKQAVSALCFAVQPDGRILTGGGGGSYILMHLLARLLANGTLDPSFQPATTYYSASTLQIEQAANGDIYYNISGNGEGLYGPSGSYGTQITQFALQPNGRIIVAKNSLPGSQLSSRLLPGGQADATYLAANGPRADAAGAGQLKRIRVQADGAIILAGSFTLAGTTPVNGLVRMLDANVLAAKEEQAESATAAWPVPASTLVNVQLASLARPQQVELLDGLGRAVLTQPVAAGTATLSLSVAAFPAGVYTLRVSYAQNNPVVRRIVLQR